MKRAILLSIFKVFSIMSIGQTSEIATDKVSLRDIAMYVLDAEKELNDTKSYSEMIFKTIEIEAEITLRFNAIRSIIHDKEQLELDTIRSGIQEAYPPIIQQIMELSALEIYSMFNLTNKNKNGYSLREIAIMVEIPPLGKTKIELAKEIQKKLEENRIN